MITSGPSDDSRLTFHDCRMTDVQTLFPLLILHKNQAMKKIVFLSIFLWVVSITATAQKSEIFIKDGYAIRGYDAVAYFSENKPVKGSEQFSFSWNGATWLFSNNENKESFKMNPERYAPQYGGYCAYGLSRG